MHFKHITLRVKNLEQSIKFYEAIAGQKVIRRFRADPAEIAFLSNGEGETEIELLHIPDSQTFEGKGMFICFETDSLDDMHKKAEDMGLNPSPVREPGDNSRYFYLYDPDGVSVQLRSFGK